MKKQLLLIILLNLFQHYCFAQKRGQQRIDSLHSVLKTMDEDTTKANLLYELSREYYINNGDKGLDYAQQSLSISEKIKYKKGISNTLNIMGIITMNNGNYKLALEFYFRALKIGEELRNKDAIIRATGNIGSVYLYEGNYPEALEYYFKALKMSEELKNKSLISNWLGGIGNTYIRLGNNSKALEYNFEALKTYEESGNKDLIPYLLSNIGNIYNNKGDFTTALEYFFKGLKINETLGNKEGIAKSITQIGYIYKQQAVANNIRKQSTENVGADSLYGKALEYYFRGLKIYEDLGNQMESGILFDDIGALYFSQKKYFEAEKYFLKALKIDSALGRLEGKKFVSEDLSKLYIAKGEYKKAYEYYKEYSIIKDSIFNIEKTKDITRKELKFDYDKKEAVTKMENEKLQAIAEEKSRKQKFIIWSVVCGLLLVALFAGFIFRSLRITRKQKQIIELKNKETEEQKRVIEEQKKVVEEKNKDITDSITYAKRIQQAKLPKKEEIYSLFPQSFILFKPKDIVSGDFYFFHKKNQSVFIAAADCTGHGVPGAFMSMIGSERLEDAVSQSTDTSEILKLLNKGIKTSLRQSDSDESTRDGMDIAICSVDIENRIVKYAGANRPLWIIPHGQKEVEVIKATKTAIGGLTEETQYFDGHEIKLKQGDTFYISTDGYADQFNGQSGKKLMTKKFKEILLGIQNKTMQEQAKYLDNFVENWKGCTEQVDDILVIGIRL